MTHVGYMGKEKYKLWPQAALHTQWPGNGEADDPATLQLAMGQLPAIEDFAKQQPLVRDALIALLDRIGPSILLTHSQSGAFGWLVADARPDLVRAILAIEPNGPPFFDVPPSAPAPTLVRRWGIAYAKLSFAPQIEQPSSLAPSLDPETDGPDMEACWLPGGA